MKLELKAALEAAMAKPALAKKILEVIEKSDSMNKAANVAEIDSEATLSQAVTALNAVIEALVDAGLMQEEEAE